MPVFFVAFDCQLTLGQLAAKRRRLASLLNRKGIAMRTVAAGDGISLAERLIRDARGSVIVVVDDEHPLPGKALWLRELTTMAEELSPPRRPVVVYVTQRASAAGQSEAAAHPLIRMYVQRDEKGRWVGSVAAAMEGLCKQLAEIGETAGKTFGAIESALVGESDCFRRAVEQLAEMMRWPYGMVSGQAGVGKMYLIQAIWRQKYADRRLLVVPCGTFFKDYYLGSSHKRFGGGRESVEQLAPFLDEVEGGLLVLHHVERLPTALQEELALRLSVRPREQVANPLTGLDSRGLSELNIKVIATSVSSAEALERSGRLLPELARKLARREVRIPSLRERGELDVELVCGDIVRRIVSRKSDDGDDDGKLKSPPQIALAAMEALRRCPWPGNISDLVTALEQSLRESRGGTIQLKHLPPEWLNDRPTDARTLDQIVDDARRTAIRNALHLADGDMNKAAKILGRNKSALYRLMKELKIPAMRADQ